MILGVALIGLVAAVWLITREEIGRLRAIDAEAGELPPLLGSAILAAEEPRMFQLARPLVPHRRPLWQHLEVALTTRVAHLLFSRDDLLRMYAHEVYMGQAGNRTLLGVDSASEVYFGKRTADLTIAEAAMIAGMIRSPNNTSPLRKPDRAWKRRSEVLAKMRARGFIDREQFTAAMAEPLVPRTSRALRQ